jgi:hypothetical protein
MRDEPAYQMRMPRPEPHLLLPSDRLDNKKFCSPYESAAQQIVGRERRERVSQLAWYGEGCFDSRRRVNSNVIWLCGLRNNVILYEGAEANRRSDG